MSNAPLKHIVFISAPSWGHLRPAIKTALRMVDKFSDLFISIFVNAPQASQAKKYLASQTSANSHRVRIVPSSDTDETASGPPVAPTNANPIEIIAGLEQSFKSWITTQLENPSTEIGGLAVNKPTWIVEDTFTGGVGLSCKDVHGLPTIAWWLGPAAALIARNGNRENGHGSRAFENMADRRAKGEAITFANATEIFVKEVSDRLVYIPGLPAHHEHEQLAQLIPYAPPFLSFIITRWTNMLKNVDYLACCATYEMEPISATALTHALPKPITPFFIGPAVDLPSITPLAKPPTPVSEFLDRAYTELGAHSVIYVAFGTVFFPLPSSIGHLTIVLEEIIAQGFRLVFALSSLSAKSSGLSSEWIDKLVQSGNAMFPEWTDQTAVLEHPAIHYFLSHGGWSSSTEALVRGVPMIFWPFISDQPANTLQLATVHNAGFELLQVRTGPAQKTAYRNGSDIVIKGTDDAVRDEIKRVLELSRAGHQRLNARLLGQVLAQSLAPGGSADVGLEKFGRLMGLDNA